MVLSTSDDLPARIRLPADLTGHRVLDLACGNGDLSAEAVRRGAASVIAASVDGSILRSAEDRHGGLGISFVRTSWQALPDGPFDIVLWVGGLERERDPFPILEALRERLAPSGTLILECGTAIGGQREVVLRTHDGAARRYPTLRFLLEVLLRDMAVRIVAEAERIADEPMPRSVLHCSPAYPCVLLVRGASGVGKSRLAALISPRADKVISLDKLVTRIAIAREHPTSLHAFVRDAYDPLSLDGIYLGLDASGLTGAYIDLLLDAVAPSDRLVVIEGHMTDQQADELRRRFRAGAVWDVQRR